MANRFLDTNYYKSPFVRSLEGALKSLYSFIICDCDGAGIWNLDLPAASLYIGFEINMLQFDENFIKKSKAIPIGGSKYFFPDFIEHQYPSGLQEKNPAHKNAIKTLKKYDLIDEFLNVKKKGALKELNSSIGNDNDKGKGKGNEGGAGGFNQKPIHTEEIYSELPKTQINSAIEMIRITQQADVTEKQIVALWSVFKVQNLTGNKFYESIDKVYNYFNNWSKSQKFVNGQQSTGSGDKLGTSAARVKTAREW